MFGAPAAPAADSAPEAAEDDDMFGAPAAPSEPSNDGASDLDDLFGTNQPSTYEGVLPAPATEAMTIVSAKVTNSMNPLADTRVRMWIDNTGTFKTQGRLIEINANFVRLMKSNGRTCTVPNDRMCVADAAYVATVKAKVEASRIAMLTSN